MGLQLQLLGGFRVYLHGEPVEGFISSKAPALLSYLALKRRELSRDVLAGLLWAEQPDEVAKTNLRQVLSNLHKLFADYLLIDRTRVSLDFNQNISVDALDFEAVSLDQTLEISQLSSLANRYKGDFLEGFYVRDAPEFEAWMLGQREYFRLLYLNVLTSLSSQYAQQGQYREASHYTRKMLALEPWHEESHRQLMLYLARMGDYSAALKHYELCQFLLEQELGVQVSLSTQKLQENIRLAMLCSSNVPKPDGPLFGREADLKQIKQKLFDPHCRMLSLVGLGGSGKTRLAQAIAAKLQPAFLHGVYFVNLQNSLSRVQLASAIASSLRLPALQDDPSVSLMRYLAEKESLILLDNFEQLLADPTSLSFLQNLVQAAPELKLLITTRERLHIPQEWVHEVRPLSSEAALDLFLHIAQRYGQLKLSEPELLAIQRSCALIGYLPLAVILAAGWTGSLEPAEMAKALEHDLSLLSTSASSRQQSMRQVFDQSWQLLLPAEQHTLVALSVCHGGFSSEAALSIADTDVLSLSRLIDKSWLQKSAGRFELHELVRHYLREKPGYKQARRNHAEYYAGLASRLYAILHSSAQKDAFHSLREDTDNLRKMWTFACSEKDSALIKQSLKGYFALFDVQGWYQEGLDSFGLALHSFSEDPELQAQLLSRLAAFKRMMGDYSASEQDFIKANQLATTVNDVETQAYSYRYMGFFPMVRGDTEQALTFIQKSVALYQITKDQAGEVDSLIALALVQARAGHYDASASLQHQAFKLAEQLGDASKQALVLDGLGGLAYYRQQYEEALSYYQASSDLFRDCQDRHHLSVSLHNLASVLIDLERLEEALVASQESSLLFRDMAYREGLMNSQHMLARIYLHQGNLDKAMYHSREAITLGLELDAEADILPFFVTVAQLLKLCNRRQDALCILHSLKRYQTCTANTLAEIQQLLQDFPEAPETNLSSPYSLKQMAQLLENAR